MHSVCKRFRTETIETTALDNVSLEVEAGEFVSIVGPSGSGKTTLLNVAGLLESFDDGSYVLGGTDVSSMGDRARSRFRNRKIGFVFQNFNLIPELSVFDNVDVPLRYRGINTKERKNRVREAINLVGLAGRIRHLPSQLSGGQQQRVAIARAICGDPSLILADEPTGNLDSKTATGVMEILQELHARGSTMLMVTHDEDLAAVAQRCIRMKDGRVTSKPSRSQD